jgi:ubiquinone/menaquinone biosynthesis C-methylase UbiE
MQLSASEKRWYFQSDSASRMRRYKVGFEQSMLRKALQREPNGLMVLDVGGGEGIHSTFVKNMGHSPVVLDFDSIPLELYLEREGDATAIQASGLALPIRDAVCDVVMTIEVSAVCTGEDDANVRYFEDVHRVLKRNGLFLMTTFNRYSYVSLLKRSEKERPRYESRYYQEGCFRCRRKLERAGFRIEDCWGYRWLPFRVESDNRLVPVMAFLEKILLLNRVTPLSPWLFFISRKV